MSNEATALNESELKTLLGVAEKARDEYKDPWFAVADLQSPNVAFSVVDSKHIAAFDPTTCAALVREVLRLRTLADKFAFDESGGSEEQVETLRTFHGKDQYE